MHNVLMVSFVCTRVEQECQFHECGHKNNDNVMSLQLGTAKVKVFVMTTVSLDRTAGEHWVLWKHNSIMLMELGRHVEYLMLMFNSKHITLNFIIMNFYDNDIITKNLETCEQLQQ